MFSLRLRATDMMKIISAAVVTVVVGFSISFSYLLYQLVTELNTVSSILGSSGAFMYLTVEGAFLALVLFAAFLVVRRKR